MKKILAFVLSLCCLLCLWTSCGKDNDKEQASSTSTADTTELLSQTPTSDTSLTTTTEPEPEPDHLLHIIDKGQSLYTVILPQAVKHMLPVLLTQVIVVFQDTSLVYVISANDFLGACSKIAQRDSQLILMYLLAAVVYLTVSLALSRSVRRFEKRGALPH